MGLEKLWPARSPGICAGRLGKGYHSTHCTLWSYDQHSPTLHESWLVCKLPHPKPQYKMTLCQVLLDGKQDIYYLLAWSNFSFLHNYQWINFPTQFPTQIQPTLGEWRPASRKSKREQVVISRLWIGNTRFTHSFIFKQEPQPQCLTCQTTCTVKHILIECRAFAIFRKRFFKVNNLTDLFENVKIDDILSFLRETELYQKILQPKTGQSCANEILLIENFTYLSIRFEIFGWICSYK